MRTIDLSRHNGQLHSQKVLARIRRKLIAAIHQKECLVVDAEYANISREVLAELLIGLPEERVKIIWPRI